MKKTTIYLIFLFLLALPILAAPPFVQEAIKLGTLEISYPIFSYHKLGENLTLHFHVSNSTGYILTNESTDCLIHLYNQSQKHIAEEFLTFDSNNLDWEITFNSNLFKSNDLYQFIIYCNGTSEAGSVIEGFQITHDGKSKTDNGSVLAIIILLPFIFMALLLYATIKMDEQHMALKWGIYLMIPSIFWATLHFAVIILIRYFTIEPLIDYIGTTIWYSGLMFWLLISYLVIFMIWLLFKDRLKSKQEDPEF